MYETWYTDLNFNVQSLNNLGFEFITAPAKKSKSKGRAKGGIVCGLNAYIYKPNNIYIKDNFMCMRISLCNMNIIVCIMYISPNSDLNLSLSDISKFPDEPLIMGGDFNSRVGNLNQIYEEAL